MPKNKLIKFRVTAMQDQLIRNKAETMGFKTKSAFIRDRLLKENFRTEKMISEMHNMLSEFLKK